MPTIKDALEVGYWNKDLTVFTVIGKTYAWNYHKGCRLQWLGSDNDKIVFNSIDNGKVHATIYSIGENNYMALDFPIDTVSQDGKHATSFSYGRLNDCMPGYGYPIDDCSYIEEKEPDHTGLFLIDIHKNTSELIMPIGEIVKIKHDVTMDRAKHFVTHTEFSPDGSRVAFMHRWTFDDPWKRYSRLITCKLDGSDINISETDGMVSHYVWDESHGILAYCRVNGIDGHYIFNDYTLKNPIRVARELNSDGHQSYVGLCNKFVTDTYPDNRRQARIYLVDIEKNSSECIVRVKSPKKFQSPSMEKHWACDLHPRTSYDGKYISFDSVHTGKRSFCVMKIYSKRH